MTNLKSAGNFEGKHSEISEKIIKAFYVVYNKLGYGFNEKVYENALRVELQKMGLLVEQQAKISVYYDGEVVGDYATDLVVENKIIVELKAIAKFVAENEAQLLNYLKASNIEVGLLLNFGPKPDLARKIFDNERKGSLEWTKPSK